MNLSRPIQSASQSMMNGSGIEKKSNTSAISDQKRPVPGVSDNKKKGNEMVREEEDEEIELDLRDEGGKIGS